MSARSAVAAVAGAVLFALAHGESLARDATAAGPYARIVVIDPHPGETAAFRDGYRRHLEWHREARDAWTWRGWTFVLGERLGMFMDGTFGHAAENFDNAVNPAGDAADNAANVTPHADFLSHGFYERLDGLGGGAPLPDSSPYLSLTTYLLEPGREQAFRSLIEAAGGPEGRYIWMRLRTGGALPQYLLLRPVASFGSAARLSGFFEADAAGEPAADSLDGTVRSIRHELLRYEPDLSYEP